MSTKREQQQRRQRLRPHPARDQVISFLQNSSTPLSPTQLSKLSGETLGSVAYHVRTLAAAGVVELADEGRVRGAVEHYYALTPAYRDLPTSDPIRLALSLCGALTVPGGVGGAPVLAELDDRARQEIRGLVDDLTAKVREIARVSTQRAASSAST